MNRRTQGFVAFGLATALVAVVLGLGLRSALMHLLLRDIPSASAEGISTSHFVASAAPRWVYSGALPAESGQPEWISIWFPEPGAPRIAITVVLSLGEGGVNLLGLVDDATGRFQAGLTSTGIGFPLFERLSGVVKGPALVNGVPAVWIEAKSEPRSSAADTERRSWSGLLLAEGFSHKTTRALPHCGSVSRWSGHSLHVVARATTPCSRHAGGHGSGLGNC